jgi:PDZ domain-containing protein
LHWTPPEPPAKNWWALVGVPLAALGVVLFLLAQIELPYVMLAPGGADPINSLLSVPKDKEHRPKGSFLLTTVSLEPRVGAFDFVRNWLGSDTQLISKKQLLGKASQKQFNQAAVQDMTESKQAAAVLALRTLGYTVAEHGSGALVLGLIDNKVPVHGVLEAGDAITSLDGVPTSVAPDAIAVLQKHKFGDKVEATVTKADNTVVQKTLTLGARTDTTCTLTADTGKGPCLGISLGTKAHRFDYPFDVKIDTAGIGGPSAGLAFTLALIDDLTAGELTGGRDVAVTGTIDIDGKVGEVGGVVQKTAAVRKAHAGLFLVPAGEYADARKHAGKHLKVVKVNTLSDALAALAANGGEVPKLAGQAASN